MSEKKIESLRQLRHDLRGAVNTLMLCTASLKYCNRTEQLEFLDDIDAATKNVVKLLDELEAMPEHFAVGEDE